MRERSEGTRGVVVASLGTPGKQEAACGGRARVGTRSSSWQRRKATEKVAVVGWAAGGAGPGKWAEVSAR